MMTRIQHRDTIRLAQTGIFLLAVIGMPAMTYTMEKLRWDHVNNYAPGHFVYFDTDSLTYGCRVHECHEGNICQGKSSPAPVLAHADTVHSGRYHASGRGRYHIHLIRCIVCDSIYGLEKNAREHVKQVHKKASRKQNAPSFHPATCTVLTKRLHPVCKKLDPHFSETMNVYPCPYDGCFTRLYKTDDIYAHINAEHTHEICYTCSGCNYWSYDQNHVKEHVSLHANTSSHNNTDSHSQHTSQ